MIDARSETATRCPGAETSLQRKDVAIALRCTPDPSVPEAEESKGADKAVPRFGKTVLRSWGDHAFTNRPSTLRRLVWEVFEAVCAGASALLSRIGEQRCTGAECRLRIVPPRLQASASQLELPGSERTDGGLRARDRNSDETGATQLPQRLST